jgi:hypothetical protein
MADDPEPDKAKPEPPVELKPASLNVALDPAPPVDLKPASLNVALDPAPPVDLIPASSRQFGLKCSAVAPRKIACEGGAYRLARDDAAPPKPPKLLNDPPSPSWTDIEQVRLQRDANAADLEQVRLLRKLVDHLTETSKQPSPEAKSEEQRGRSQKWTPEETQTLKDEYRAFKKANPGKQIEDVDAHLAAYSLAKLGKAASDDTIRKWIRKPADDEDASPKK